tara:strand:- start:360 stop:563 length:204 start_codon:yes stop_codon:yes gene_type:complete
LQQPLEVLEPVEEQRVHPSLPILSEDNKEINPLFHLLKVIREEEVMLVKEAAVAVPEQQVNQLLLQT